MRQHVTAGKFRNGDEPGQAFLFLPIQLALSAQSLMLINGSRPKALYFLRFDDIWTTMTLKDGGDLSRRPIPTRS